MQETNNVYLANQNIRSKCGFDLTMTETIHSGQFMVSKYDEDSETEDDNNNSKIIKPLPKGYNFNMSLVDKNFTFSDTKLEIDESLQKMFQYLSIAMSGKITNPKWNSFKGVKFGSKDKIRLNNIIWREYHMQFVKKLVPVVVQFASPLSETPQVHGNVVLEGKFWKRRQNIIVHQYKQWRQYFKDRTLLCQCCGYGLRQPEDPSSGALFNRIHFQRPLIHQRSSSPPPNLNDIFMDLDDHFFMTSVASNIMGVDGNCGCGGSAGGGIYEHNCQVIQPQLTNLQPRMDSTLDFLNDFLAQPDSQLRSQRPFSSESSLNAYQQPHTSTHQFSNSSNIKTISPQCNKPSPLMLPSISSVSAIVSSSSASLSSSQLCKTPNLLSILLQPIPSTSTTNYLSENLSNQSTLSQLISASTSPTSVVNSLSNKSYSSYKQNNPKKTSPSTPVSVSANVKSFTTPSESVSSRTNYQTSQYNQSSVNSNKRVQPPPMGPRTNISSNTGTTTTGSNQHQIRQSLTTNNLVQQHLDELARLILSNREQNKVSKAALLHKASDLIRRLRSDKYRLQTEISSVHTEIDSLQSRFSLFCSQLPATGVCVVNTSRGSEGRHWFDEFVLLQSKNNWKFYIFCMIFESLFVSYNQSVNTTSMESLAHSVASWLEKECSLMKLRHIVMNGMRSLSRRTNIVHNPRRVADDIRQLVANNNIGNRVISNSDLLSTNMNDPVYITNSNNNRQHTEPTPTSELMMLMDCSAVLANNNNNNQLRTWSTDAKSELGHYSNVPKTTMNSSWNPSKVYNSTNYQLRSRNSNDAL